MRGGGGKRLGLVDWVLCRDFRNSTMVCRFKVEVSAWEPTPKLTQRSKHDFDDAMNGIE